jgi:hypothetical protein
MSHLDIWYQRKVSTDIARGLHLCGTWLTDESTHPLHKQTIDMNRWEICLRMRYNLRGLRERDLGRVNIVI